MADCEVVLEKTMTECSRPKRVGTNNVIILRAGH